jgi:hypothetical protein
MLQIKNPNKRILQAIEILTILGVPKAQLNPRTGLCLLALLNITPKKSFNHSESQLIGITPIMDFCKQYYKITYAPNSRETFRRFSMHQLVQAGIALYNPDENTRPTNSPNAVYQIAPDALALIKTYKTPFWKAALIQYQANHQTLTSTYAKSRDIAKISVTFKGKELKLSSGKHNLLIKDIIDKFAAYFLQGASLVYVGDTANRSVHIDKELIKTLSIPYDEHNKFPDIIFGLPEKSWLVLVESVTSHGPMDSKRHFELEKLFEPVLQDIVYVTAFPDKKVMSKYVNVIAWETEVWLADNPTHLIHFNGSKFLGPYHNAK